MSNEENLIALLNGASSNRGPSDLEQLQKTIAQNDLYSMAAAPILSAKFDTSTWNPTEKIGTSLLQSFLGTALGELGKKSQASQLEAVAQILPQLYQNPSSVARPEGVDRQAFSNLQMNAVNKMAATDENIRNNIEIQKATHPNIRISGPYAEALAKFGDEGLARDYVKATDPAFAKDASNDADTDLAKRKDALKYIDAQFEVAKNIHSASTFNPFSTANTDLMGVRSGIENLSQAVAGREYNKDFAVEFRKTLPAWNDSKAQIEAKRKQVHDLVSTLSVQKSKTGSGLPDVTSKAPSLDLKGYTPEQIAYGKKHGLL